MELGFRFVMYVFVGLSCEAIFSVCGIEFAMGNKIEHRVPRNYLEGFVSLYMIPVHGFGILFCYEYIYFSIQHWHIVFRYILWAFSFAFTESLVGFIYDKIFGFYPWDYYEKSKYKIFKRGYCLWTLLPCWGIYGLFLEIIVQVLVYSSPFIHEIF